MSVPPTESVGLIRRLLARLPTSVAVALGFTVFIALGALFAVLAPPPRDLRADCIAKCSPLPGRLVDDKTYPLSAKRPNYPQVCKCGSEP